MDKKTQHADPMGAALMEYWRTQDPFLELMVSTDISEPDPYPVSYFFRDLANMPAIEQTALQMARGAILDVGAGSGAHALVLQQQGQQVLPIDISALSVELMQERGLKQAVCQDFFSMSLGKKFDTILLLMNGIGLVKTMDNFPNFFKQIDKLLADGGQVLADSSDIIYMFQDEEGCAHINLNDNYYGELSFSTTFKGMEGAPYPWLFVDFDNLQAAAHEAGFSAECVMHGKHYDYLARITRQK